MSSSAIELGAAKRRRQAHSLLPLLALTAIAACETPAPQPPRFAPGFASPTPPAATAPTATTATPTFTSISSRCALATDGRLFCFGKFFPNDWTPDERNHARPVFGLSDVALFDTSPGGICLTRKTDPRRVLCAPEISTYVAKYEPLTEWVAPEPIREVSTVAQCAIGVSSAVYCWGWDSGQQFLAGGPYVNTSGVSRLHPVERMNTPPARSFVRDLGRCIATEDGRIGCWGKDNWLEQVTGSVPQTQTITWLPGSDLKDAFRYGTHPYSMDGGRKEARFCLQSRADVFSCPDPKLTAWLNDNHVTNVYAYYDSLLALTRERRALAYRIAPASKTSYDAIREGLALDNVAAIGRTFDHAVFCVLDVSGTVKCVGHRDEGALGNGEALSSPVPLKVNVPAAVELTSSISTTTCVRHADGGIHCWAGFDGHPSVMPQRGVTELHPPEPSLRIVGAEPLCSLGTKGWYCEGSAIRAERADGWSLLRDLKGTAVAPIAQLDITPRIGLGINVTMPNGSRSWFYEQARKKPLRLEPLEGTGLPGTFDCSIHKDGTRGCGWASGDGYSNNFRVPNNVNPRKAMGGALDGWLLTDTGDLYFGARPKNDNSPAWEAAPRLRAVRDAVVIEHPEQNKTGSLCALLEDGQVVCAGPNRYGELGDGTFTAREAFQPVRGLSKAKSIAVGHHHLCALTENGEVFCWGSDEYGALGQGTKAMNDTLTPIVIRDR